MKRILKHSLAICLVLFFSFKAFTQDTRLPYKYPKCNTSWKGIPPAIPDAESFLRQLGNSGQRINFSAPYFVRVFIRIVRETNGSLPGCTREEAMDNFTQMNGQYAAHNICFQLMGIDFVNDSYLNNFNDENLLDTDYPAYIRNNNLDVDGAVTIFVHYNFLNNNGSSGNAYGIPNNFLSVARWAATSPDVNSIFGHEMGHCMGLYHTFETVNAAETVTRNSSNSCYNCNISGDLCCDTPADYPDSQDNTNSTSCNYFGSATDACSVTYSPSTINIMSYQPWGCISTGSNAITSNQRSRMHATILNVTGPVYNRVSEDNLVLNTGSFSTNLVRIYGAKNNITMSNNASITQSGSSQAYYTAGNDMVFGPGTNFVPGSAGVVQLSISRCN
jgi:hypothetical protein